uniref:Kinesin motor domain-containing protein n=1 Tax=Kalanchoe fedtschenkoi TaxID=63787 RepID=A0A7N0UGK4_KALFE
MASSPKSNHHNSQAEHLRKVRVIGRIRGGKSISSDWLSNNHKHIEELDYCYETNDNNSTLFSAEIKPLVSSIFDGHCASIIAFGATASGKSHTIQGSGRNPGLAVLAMEEFLLMAGKAGLSVSVSYYEVYQEQVYDLLNKDKNAVFVLEDAQGKIQLKGLSQAFVETMIDFQKLYMNDSHKKTQKMASQPFRRSHKGLIIHLFASDASAKQLQLVGKMNFVDLAGFVDPRRESIDSYTIAENSRINKSLLALQSVICALNCNDSRVPYRDSKLTYMLRDTFSGTNKILMIACLNPTVCQDTAYILNLASRCTKGNRRVFMDSEKIIKSTQKSAVKLSAKDFGKTVTASSSINAKHQTACSTLKKKLTNSRLPLSEKRTNNKDVPVPLEGRKLFDAMEQRCTVEKASAAVKVVSDTLQPSQECASAAVGVVSDAVQPSQECENYFEVIDNPTFQSVLDEDCRNNAEKQESPGHGASPPITARLQELSDYMKSVLSSTPLNMQQEFGTTSTEPKTPIANNTDARPWTATANNTDASPWTTLKVCSASVKKCLTEEYVRFFNSASKDELKGLKGIGEKRATRILNLREKSPDHFKNIDDLKEVGLSGKLIQKMMKDIL